MTKIFIDFETYSTCDLKVAGVHKYAMDRTTGIWCMAYAFDEGPVLLWKKGDPVPEAFRVAMRGKHRIICHNLPFEANLWEQVLHPIYKFPEFKIENGVCTMAEAYALGLPGSLEKCALALNLDVQKDMKGSRIAVQLSKPKLIDIKGNPVWHSDPERFEILYKYCVKDVEVQREIYKKLLRLSPSEKKVWVLDYEMNKRGLCVDVPALLKAHKIIESEQKYLNDSIRSITSNRIATINATSQFLNFLKEEGHNVDSVGKPVVASLLATNLSPLVRQVLEMRQTGAKSSVAKVIAMINRACGDGRMRGLYQYHGSHTGRWAGRGPQVQNFPRITTTALEVNSFFDALKDINTSNYDVLKIIFGNPLEVVSKNLRGFIVPGFGLKLIGADFSSIEARVLAWLTNEKKTLTIFRTHGKVYEQAASDIYKVPLDKVNKDQRQIGKVAVLALGYQGGKAAFQKMAENYGVKVTADEADHIKNKWREANPNIVKFWYDIENKAVAACSNPGEVFESGRIKIVVKGSFLFIRLPSGRVLSYPFPKLQDIQTPWGETKKAFTYMGEDSVTHKWERQSAYGGLLTENIVQAIARDIMVHAMLLLDAHGYKPVMTTHDEVVCEHPHPNEREFEELMVTLPPWAEGLPLDCEAFSGERYIK